MRSRFRGAIQLQFRVSESFSESFSELQLNWPQEISEWFWESSRNTQFGNDSQTGSLCKSFQLYGPNPNLGIKLRINFRISSIQLQLWEWFSEWFWNSELQLNCAPAGCSRRGAAHARGKVAVGRKVWTLLREDGGMLWIVRGGGGAVEESPKGGGVRSREGGGMVAWVLAPV